MPLLVTSELRTRSMYGRCSVCNQQTAPQTMRAHFVMRDDGKWVLVLWAHIHCDAPDELIVSEFVRLSKQEALHA